MARYKQDSPFCVKVELTEGCNLRCHFCGLNGIRGKANDYKFMSEHTAEKIADLIRYEVKKGSWGVPRIEFTMHGEPTMNPKFIQLIQKFTIIPGHHLMMTTNGGGLVKDTVDKILRLVRFSGLKIIAIDDYTDIPFAGQVRKAIKKSKKIRDAGIDIYEYPSDLAGNPHKRRKSPMVTFIAPIDTTTEGTHNTLNNGCGAAAPYKDIEARCARPFRELAFRFSGEANLCCNDWRGVMAIGNVMDYGRIETLWQHKAFQYARKALYNKVRSFEPCLGCDNKSTRVGLLPDKLGKESLKKPTSAELRFLRESVKEPSTTFIEREWEKEKEGA